VAADLGYPGNPGVAKTVAAIIREFERQGHADPIRKAREHLSGGAVAKITKERASELRAVGLSPDQANAQAAREMEKALLHRHRESSRPTVTKARADLGQIIKAAREAERVPVETIAGRVGVTPRSVWLWERGEAICDQPLKLAKALGLNGLTFAEKTEKARKGES
jgi:ribosome-binding protein aMBF1 (putative translation factor)